MILVVTNAKFFGNDLCDTATGPNVATKSISLGTVPKKLGDEAFLLRRQFGSWPDARRLRKAFRPPCRTNASQRLTQTSDTPKAEAISRWRHPLCLSSMRASAATRANHQGRSEGHMARRKSSATWY